MKFKVGDEVKWKLKGRDDALSLIAKILKDDVSNGYDYRLILREDNGEIYAYEDELKFFTKLEKALK